MRKPINTTIYQNLLGLCLICLLAVMPSSLFAQQNPDSLADKSRVEHRTFDESSIQEYRKDTDFDYERIVDVETYSIWDHFWDFIYKLFADSSNRTAMEVLMYVVCGAIMLFVILRLLGISPRQLFYGKPADNIVKTRVLEDDIHGIDFEQEIAQAEVQSNWKEAIRLHYLSVLKTISDQGLIVWKINKTNHDYEIEIQNEILKKPFHQVTQVYEYVCYGSFSMDEVKYQRFKGQFVDFAGQVA